MKKDWEIIFKQLSFGFVVVICPYCKEICSPVAEWQEKYVDVSELTRRNWLNGEEKLDGELILWYNHKPSSPKKRDRIYKIVLILD